MYEQSAIEQGERPPITPEEWNGGLEYYRERKEKLIAVARMARKNLAVSYRNFYVGCVAVTITKGKDDENARYGVTVDANFKPELNDEEWKWAKRCAEVNALAAAKEGRAKAIAALVTISEEVHTGDPTDPTLSHDVLHPCHSCRMVFRELLEDGILRNDTVICNARDFIDPDTGEITETKIEERLLGELLDLYKEDLPFSQKLKHLSPGVEAIFRDPEGNE